jgi:hypothetical protein
MLLLLSVHCPRLYITKSDIHTTLRVPRGLYSGAVEIAGGQAALSQGSRD